MGDYTYNQRGDVTDIRKSNIFREGFGDENHRSMLNFRLYTREDLIIIGLFILITVVVYSFCLTKKSK